MRREDKAGLFGTDRGDDRLDRCRCKGRLCAVALPAGFKHAATGRDAAHLENLRPAEAEPAVADDEAFLVGGELAGDGLHAEGAAAGDDDRGPGVINLFDEARDVLHYALKALGHVVQGAVGIDHGIFEQAVGIGVRQEGRHGRSPVEEGKGAEVKG